MHHKIKSNASFIRLVVHTSKFQAVALLETVTKKQTDCISEIILNLSKGNIVKLNENLKIILHKSRRILNSLKNRSLSNRRRSAIIKSHPKVVLELLKFIGKDLLNLV